MKSRILRNVRTTFLLSGLCLMGNFLQAQTFTFTNAGATGINGPTQIDVSNAYSSTNLAGNVTVTGAGIQNWVVPVGGLYKIEVYGANGYGPFAGRGAYMSGEFNFNAADALKILVGQQGGCCVGSGTEQYGGGGGSFVVDVTNTPIIVAGGGGGVNGATSIPVHSDANITTNGNAGVGTTSGSTGGTNGGGGGGVASAGGGGGFSGDGGVAAGFPGGFSFLNGGVGGTSAGSGGWGGFGGGGGANSWNNRRGGGGGGYSGGGGAGSSTSGTQAGGGGGSYNTGANQINVPAMGTGHGSVVITLLVPAVSLPNNTGATGFPSLTAGICPGVQTISVKVRNFGNNIVTAVKVGWEVNGVFQSDLVYPVALDPYPGPVYEQTINVGTFNFAPGAASIKAWTSFPNGLGDPDNSNDTTVYSVPVSLTGLYTLNSALATGGTNFQTFTDFTSALSVSGICGPVTLDVVAGSGPYAEQVTIPQVTGSSATNTITINGNGNTLTHTQASTGSNYATFRLDGADYVTVDSLNIEALGASYGFGIHLGNSSDNNSFNSCNITINPTATATTSAGVVMSGSPAVYSTAGMNGSNNTFTGCHITGGYFGFSFYGTSPSGNDNNSIINCSAKEYYVYGSYNLQQGNATISGNLFERPTRAATSTFYGVLLTTGCTNMLVEKNTIRNAFTMNPTSTSAAYCLYCSVDATSGNENKFINNLVYNINNNGTTYGMYFSGADYVHAYHNTISLDYTASTAGTTYGLYSTGTVGGMDFKNNNITITRGGSGTKYCLYYSGGQQISNNNNLYINSAGGTNSVGYYGTAFTTLANWQTANSGAFDAMSISADPQYANPGNGDYTPTNVAVDNLGTPLGVMTDIMGTPRDPVVPDMGAYEVPNAPCTAPPTPGMASANPTSGLCGGDNIFLTLTGFSGGSSQSYMWEESTIPGGPYTSITAPLASPGTTILATTTKYYRAAVTCGASTTYSSEVLVTVGAVSGTATTPSTSICVGGNVGLSLTGHIGNVQWEYYDNTTSSWLPIAGATTANYTMNNLQATTDFRAAVSCTSPTGSVYSNVLSVTALNPSITDVFDGSRCDPGPVTLAAKGSPGTTVKWYDAITAGNLLATGGAYTTPPIASTTTYYASASTGGGSGPSTVPLPAHGSNYTGNVRGMWFTAPVGFTITGLQAMAQTTGSQSIAVVKFNAPPPIYSTTTNAFTVLYLTQSNPIIGSIPVNIQVNAGDHIGVLSQVSNQTSYATPSGPFSSTIGGMPVTLTRIGMQFPLTTTAPQDLWEETGGAIGRTEITYQIGCEGTRVPVTATITGNSSGTGLATGGTTTGANHLDGTTVNYNDGCNDKVATVVDAVGGNTLGVTSAIALTSSTVQTFNGAPYVTRAFDITPASTGPATVTLYALQSEFTAYNSYVTSNSLSLPLLPTGPLDVAGMSNIKITQFHGSAFAASTGPLGLYDATNVSFITNNNITVTWSGQYWAMTFPVTGFSGFFIHSGNSPLAIDLGAISAINSGSRNRIDWHTVSESAGDKFELERSAEGTTFTKLAMIHAKGEATSYNYWDNDPVVGINYYRLKIINASGKFSYSRTVSATLKGKGVFSIEAYPNPMREQCIVEVYGQLVTNAYVTVSNLEGKVLKHVTMSGNKAEVNMSGFTSGIYLIKYHDDEHSETIKMTKL